MVWIKGGGEGGGYGCQYVRVVKEADSKSAGVTRTGSNPVADAFLPTSYCPSAYN